MGYYHHTVCKVENLLLSLHDDTQSLSLQKEKIDESLKLLAELRKELRESLDEQYIENYQSDNEETRKQCLAFLYEMCSEKKCCCEYRNNANAYDNTNVNDDNNVNDSANMNDDNDVNDNANMNDSGNSIYEN